MWGMRKQLSQVEHWLLGCLARQAATASGEAFKFGEIGIMFLRPLCGGGGDVASGVDALGNGVAGLVDILQTQGLEDLAGFVEVVICDVSRCGGGARKAIKSGRLAHASNRP